MIRPLLILFLALFPLAARAEVPIQQVTSDGGITAWLVEERSIPFVAMNIGFRGGTSLEPLDKRGVTNLMVALLEEGAGDLDDTAFQERAEALAARFSFSVSPDNLRVSAQFLTENRAESLALLRLAITQPRFDAEAVERVRGQVFANIESQKTDPSDIAYNTLAAMAYPDHPYGLPEDGTVDTVSALTQDDLRQIHAQTFTKDRLYVSVVGDIDAATLGPILDDLLGDLPETSPLSAPRRDYDLAGGVTVVPFPSPQSVVVWSQPGMDRQDDDFMTLSVLNHILGGSGFTARLSEEVREKRGLTYSIGTYPASRDLSHSWIGQFSSTNAVVGEAMDVIRTIWADVAENGPTEDEVAQAITYLTGAYPLRFDGNATIASILTGMQLTDLPIDYVATRNDKMRAITPQDVRRVAAEVMDPDALRFIVVGEPQGIEPTQ